MNNGFHLGFGIFGGHSLEQIISYAKRAEEIGLDACWIFEDYFYGGAFTTATACALNTRRLQIGIGVINPFTRHPVLSAMEAAALDALSEGRLILGMGGSNRRWMEEQAGIPFVRPIQAAAEATEIIRSLIRDRRVKYQGEVFRTGDVRLEFETYRSDMPVYMGVKGPKALFRAGRIADGVVLSSLTGVDYVRYAKRHIAAGARSAGRDPAGLRIAAYFPTYIDPDGERAREKVKPYLAKFIGIHGFHPILFEAGLTREVIEPFKEAVAAGHPERAIPLVSDALIGKLAVAGTPEECLEKFRQIQEAGVDMPIPFELPGEDPLTLLEQLSAYVLCAR